MLFDVAASKYEAFMGRWSRLLAGPFADYAGVASGQRVLDVGAGTGALTAALVDRVGATNVTAVEPAASFVAALRDRFAGVEVVDAPAERLPFADRAFDAALAQLVVHFMADPLAGVREMARVTRPDAVVAVSVWDFGGARDPLRLYWSIAHQVDGTVKDESALSGTREGQLAELLVGAGLADVQSTALTVELRFDTFEAWWAPFEGGVGPAGVHYAGLDPERRVRMRALARDGFGQPPVTIAATAWAARGRVA